MKVQCDVCQAAEASVFCCADEAALCMKCDSKVHAANKLASKHPRLSLHDPHPHNPRCDICQEKRAFFFCKEDRAVLCRDCDFSIHSANDFTGKHVRFLVPGIKVSLQSIDTPSLDSSSSLSSPLVSAGVSACHNNQEIEMGMDFGLTKAVNKKLKTNPLTDLPVFPPKPENMKPAGSGDISQYLNVVEEFLASSPSAPIDWFSINDSSKGDNIGKALAADWAADAGLQMEAFNGDTLAEVPVHTLSTSKDSEICAYGQLGIFMKPKPRQQQTQAHPFFTPFNAVDDAFLVPELSFITPTKRIRPSWDALIDFQI